MNLKGFKKIHQDEHKAVLRNSKGHEITVALKSLSAKHLAGMKELPLHAAEGSAPVSNGPDLGVDTSMPEAPQMPEAQTPAPQASDGNSNAPTISPLAGPAQMPDLVKGVITPEQYNEAATQNRNAQAGAWASDLINGHIKPETYQDLFAKKDTVGKLSTLFGLLVGGAGAGLSHQPSAILQMMDQEIDRDFKAQQESKANAKNFLTLNLQHQLQKAQLPEIAARTNLTQAQTDLAKKQAVLEAQAAAKNYMTLGVLHHFADLVNKQPAQTKPAAQAAFQMAGQAAQSKIQQTNAQTEAQYNELTRQLPMLEMMGVPEAGAMRKYREDHYLPGVGTADLPASEGDREGLVKINKFQSLLNEAEQLRNKLKGAGGIFERLLPADKTRALQIKNDMVTGYNDVKGLNRLNEKEANYYEGIVPDIASIKGEITGSTSAGLERLKDSVANVKQIYLDKLHTTPFHGTPQDTQQPEAPVLRELPHKKTGRIGLFDDKNNFVRWKDGKQ